jgi:hypothetical protein
MDLGIDETKFDWFDFWIKLRDTLGKCSIDWLIFFKFWIEFDLNSHGDINDYMNSGVNPNIRLIIFPSGEKMLSCFCWFDWTSRCTKDYFIPCLCEMF